ncbi:TPA: hypothetical protein N0F65_007805 [Lagenidium giganteum]|uniref:Phosphoenolpyruvate carboxykinase (ATP) n=1 Tax=Lagenidium giganteum TaxID=4803 RepID=A0AAV2Z362_9STRA|nr:TPA: hypothetical protein N0F65_007805 [Lagenidium giganteum]
MALRLGLKHALRASIARPAVARSFSVSQHAADKLLMDFPEQREGLNIEFNWSLADDDVTPHGEAYRNLKWARLQELAKDAKPAGKKASIEQVDVSVSFAEFQSTFEKVTNYLSLADEIFAHDGAVGSFKDDRTRVRVISDSPVVALFAQNILVRVPTKDVHAQRPIVVYVATGGDFAGKEPKALMLLDKDENDALFAKVVITGAADLRTVMNAVGLAKQKLVENSETESVVLPCDVVVKNDKSALVFNADATRSSAVASGLLYAAHQNIWSPAGVTSVFGGAVVNDAKVASKQALPIEDGVAVHVPCNNLVDHPKAAFFFQKSGGVKSISAQEAASLLIQSGADVDAEKFAGLLKNADTKTYVVSSQTDIEATLAKL